LSHGVNVHCVDDIRTCGAGAAASFGGMAFVTMFCST
jgi:hypothetical protein